MANRNIIDNIINFNVMGKGLYSGTYHLITERDNVNCTMFMLMNEDVYKDSYGNGEGVLFAYIIDLSYDENDRTLTFELNDNIRFIPNGNVNIILSVQKSNGDIYTVTTPCTYTNNNTIRINPRLQEGETYTIDQQYICLMIHKVNNQ